MKRWHGVKGNISSNVSDATLPKSLWRKIKIHVYFSPSGKAFCDFLCSSLHLKKRSPVLTKLALLKRLR